jgi:amino acid transporter
MVAAPTRLHGDVFWKWPAQLVWTASNSMAATASQSSARLPRELGLRDLVLAQILNVVGSAWVGVASKLGKAHAVFWILSMLLFYAPLSLVVIYINRALPLEGGLYQWAKEAFGSLWGFLIAWNLWVYAVIVLGSILFVIPTDLAYSIGPSVSWLPASHAATSLLTGIVLIFIAWVAVRGLSMGKWLHNAGGSTLLLAYGILVALPLWAILSGQTVSYTPVPFAWPGISWVNLALFGQITVGGLSGFEYIAIMAGECRDAGRNIGRAVAIAAPVIALMFILGTSSVITFVGDSPINLIGPIPQTFRAALGNTGFASRFASIAILLLLVRAVSAASLIFTGLTRLPVTAGWDRLLPDWFTRLDPRRRTPVNSILFVTGLAIVLIFCSMLGVREQEALQLLNSASNAHYGIAYVALFAIPLFGSARLRKLLPRWLRIPAFAGLVSAGIAVLIAVYPIVDVVSNFEYAGKIIGIVLVSNIAGVLIYSMRNPTALRQR